MEVDVLPVVFEMPRESKRTFRSGSLRSSRIEGYLSVVGYVSVVGDRPTSTVTGPLRIEGSRGRGVEGSRGRGVKGLMVMGYVSGLVG